MMQMRSLYDLLRDTIPQRVGDKQWLPVVFTRMKGQEYCTDGFKRLIVSLQELTNKINFVGPQEIGENDQ